MTLATAVAVAMFAGVLMYALFGGADFGSGLFDLTAGGSENGGELRALIDHSIGPVWEANHVWLIYILVMWWTGFPTAFAAVTTTLFLPLVLALLGIVLRGASFAFRKYSATVTQARLFGAVFAGSSLITPFFLGAVAGSVASGRVPAAGNGDLMGSWLNPTSLFGGAIAVGTCSFLAGAFLTADAARSGHPRLSEQLRTRTMGVGIVTGMVVFAALIPIRRDAPTLSDALLGAAAPLIVISAAAGALTLVMLYRRQYSLARVGAVAAVSAVVVGWGVAQYPWVLVDQVRIADGAGAESTLVGLLVVVALAGIIVVPSLAYLYSLTQSARWTNT